MYVFVTPYILIGVISDFIKQIILGDTGLGEFTFKMINATKPDIRSRCFYLFWAFEIYIWIGLYSLLFVLSELVQLNQDQINVIVFICVFLRIALLLVVV